MGTSQRSRSTWYRTSLVQIDKFKPCTTVLLLLPVFLVVVVPGFIDLPVPLSQEALIPLYGYM
eukprot:307816-Rhodomonas_salina.1